MKVPSQKVPSQEVRVNPNPLGILARNLPESSINPPVHFWKHAIIFKYTMHFR